MPSTSKKQHNFMEAVAHNPSFAKKVGVPQSVGKDFSNADKGKTFKRGGDMVKAKKMSPGMAQAMGRGRPSSMPSRDPGTGGPRGGRPSSMPSRDSGTGGPRGGRPSSMPSRDSGTGAAPNRPRSFGSTINSAPRTPPSASLNKPAGMGMKKGGMAASSMGKVKTAAPSKDGVAAKGKTKGKMVTMKSGGKAYC